MADATDTENLSSAHRHFSQQADPHPYRFTDIQDARRALRAHMHQAEDAAFGELGKLAKTISAFADALLEAKHPNANHQDHALSYLGDRLLDVVEDVEEWMERAWLLSVIVADDDVGALARYPGTKEHAPPPAEEAAETDELQEKGSKRNRLLDNEIDLYVEHRAQGEAIRVLNGIITARAGKMPELTVEEREALEKAMARLEALPSELERPSADMA